MKTTSMKTSPVKSRAARLSLILALATSTLLAGCVEPQPRYGGYQPQPVRCQNCGVVQQVDQVYVQGGGGNGNGGTLGAVIGAVAGGILGSTIGKGDGRTAATVVGAVGGGVVGNQIGKRNDGGDGNSVAWRIVVQMDNGQYATVTQREDPRVRNGAYVSIHDGHVFPR